jgi:peptide/nickel transport system permease protein
MAFPLIIIALTVVVASRAAFPNAGPEYQILFVVFAITIPFIPKCARVVRSSALAIREIPYIDAARANGFSNTRIILRHMVPNVMAPFLIMITSFVGQAILLEASLSFLGLGVQEPTAAWGLMLRSAQEHAESAPWTVIWPGVAITLAVFGFNIFGDAVRDALDPRLRSQ